MEDSRMNMEDIKAFLSRINGITFKKVIDIGQGNKFRVLKVEKVDTKYGEQIHIDTKDFFFYLPKSWQARLTPEKEE